MKALIYKNKINVVPLTKKNGYRLWVRVKKPLNDTSEPLIYTTIYANQKVYELPCPRKNIKGLYIKKF